MPEKRDAMPEKRDAMPIPPRRYADEIRGFPQKFQRTPCFAGKERRYADGAGRGQGRDAMPMV
ncbi:hypothetical protein, partial [Bordetella sp. FB-8]|uniref:hypothetical protein n=1 Tax=Bordetella sp. FB-8 TaxID=1159870 RepID=UPI001E283E83